jgi:hypothetical protein
MTIEAEAEHATETAAADLAGTAAGDAAATGAAATTGEMDSTATHTTTGGTLDWSPPEWVEPTWETVESDGFVTRTSSDGQTEVIHNDGGYEWYDAHGNSNYSWAADSEGVSSGGYSSEWGGGSWTSGTEAGAEWHESQWWDSEGNGGGSNRDWSSYEYTKDGLYGEMDSEGNWSVETADGEKKEGTNWEGYYELIYPQTQE